MTTNIGHENESGPAFTVAICTRNRAPSLRSVLDSIAAADAPSTEWELIVVDNGSTDDTAEVIGSFADRLPIRRAWQPVAGLSNARNKAVEAASGRHILWTDDDVLVRPGWLRAFADAFAAHPDAAIFGGIVLPMYEPPVVPWFAAAEDQLRTLLAYRNFSGAVDPARMPFGACYAVRMAEQRRFAYDPELGVAPGRRIGGEETAVLEAIYAAGGRGIWVEGGIVDHIISQDRQTIAYIVQFYRSHGLQHPDRPRAPDWLRIAGVPFDLMTNIPVRYARYRLKRALGLGWVGALRDYARALGTVDAVRAR